MYCDNQAIMFTINNLTFQKHTKYVEMNFNFFNNIRHGLISTP